MKLRNSFKMAGNDGTSAELFPGWSSVVHQPAEDPEESDLPSTVDITAFTSSLNVEPNNAGQNDENSDSESDSEPDSSNSGTDASQSCSQSDSSDSDSSTSSQSSRSDRSAVEQHEFSVTSSQTDGLRLTIAAKKKTPAEEERAVKPLAAPATTKRPSSSSSPTSASEETASDSEPNTTRNKAHDATKMGSTRVDHTVTKTGSARVDPTATKTGSARVDPVATKTGSPVASKTGSPLATKTGSPVATKTGSPVATKTGGSSVKAERTARRMVMRSRTKQAERREEKGGRVGKREAAGGGAGKGGGGKGRQRPRRTRKMASLPLSRGSTYSSSSSSEDSDAEGMLAACSLQEIRQEDLAAILPDQQEIDAFDFECARSDKNSPAAGDMSGSDMELPQQAVNALIQRTTESSSEGEAHAPPNPGSLYANSLLQQFVAQTQLLNAPCPVIASAGDILKPPVLPGTATDCQNAKVEGDNSKRRRGRPKKEVKPVETANEYCTNPNVSPDSGIQNSPDHVSSPEPALSPSIKQKVKEDSKKIEKQPAKPAKTVPAPTKSKELPKIPMTATRFDRALYGAVDRVLYPPRRRVGRPPINKKGPGRPPKSKPEPAKPTEKVVEKQPKVLKGRHKTRTVLSVKNKVALRSKYQTLKIPKLMHDRHKHKKHKKYKFKILKPVAARDPKISIEIDALVADFIKCCVIAAQQPKENVPEQILKTLKKVTKKRKTTDHSEKKKKKQNVTVADSKVHNSNEQRLPLKKRHYHLVNSTENKIEDSEIKKEPEEDVKVDKVKVKQSVAASKEKEKPKGSTTPKSDSQKSPVSAKCVPVIKSNVASPKVQNINNNDYDIKEKKESVESHVVEAIEACVSRLFEEKPPAKSEVKGIPDEKTTNNGPITTPKKRHRLEMVNSAENLYPDVKTEVAPEQEEKPKPKISIEGFITELKVKRNLIAKSPVREEKKPVEKNAEKKITEKNAEKKITEKNAEKTKDAPVSGESDVKLSPESAKKKVRKRRAINRTGFPTVKKKKKKPSCVAEPTKCKPTEPQEQVTKNACDRVPKEGEECAEFVQRTEKPESSVATPVPPEKCHDDDSSSRWEFMSECESLPQDERTEFDDDLKPDRMTLRRRDLSPATSVDARSTRSAKNDDVTDDLDVSLESSIERLRSRLEERKKRKRGNDDKLPDANGRRCYPKRKVRDGSPAGSAEPLHERRLKEEVASMASASGDEKRGRKAPRWRKKYLVAGLFSDYYKEDDESVRLKRAENAHKPSRLAYNPSEHPYGLLPAPHHCGKYLRCRRLPFRLPYDIWWQHTHSQLPGRDVVPSWNYRKVRTNVYNTKTSTGACEPQSCNCGPSSDCGDDCINRLVLSECPASHRCGNQRIQRHEWSPGLEKFMTDSKGWGVRTKLPINQGEFILEYVGEVVSDQEFKERMGTIYVNDTHHYCLHLDGGLFIDGHRMGGDGRFVNHSCAPNCEMQKWSVNGQFRMALFALRGIEGGEELTYDYNFSLFNPAEGQECKCGSETCRGVIGGKSQRVRQLPEPPAPPKHPGRVGRPRKTEAKKKKATAGGQLLPALPPAQAQPAVQVRVGRPRKTEAKRKTTVEGGREGDKVVQQVVAPVMPMMQVRPISHQQRCFVLERHCFLLRNLTKVRKVRDRSPSTTSVASSRQRTATPTDASAFANHLNALKQPRSMKTRRVARGEDDPELSKTVKLAALLKEIWGAVTAAKDEKGDLLATPFTTMPSKRKAPDFYAQLANPIDLATIEQNIATGVYKTAESFDEDFHCLFRNYARFYGRTSDIGVAAAKLKKVYAETKKRSLERFEDAVGEKPPAAFVCSRKKSEEEDIIRCICGIPRDEGLMIQCERCFVWQHCECVKADASASSYHCEKCVPRDVDYEIPMDEYTEHNHRYYMTLMRGDLQLRQGDTVYVLRDIPIEGTDRKHTYDTIGEIDYAELDIFRIERLWKEEKTGRRLAYGHHYLRPHETFHEPTRKFFPNEVMRVPLYEAVPVELVISPCWVLDVNTFCKGRPIGADERHVYICEYRVDKAAKMFSKVSRSKYPVCTKSFAFEKFETRLRISRTYCPHDVDEALMKGGGGGRRAKTSEEGKEGKEGGSSGRPKEVVATVPALPPVVRTPSEQRARLNRISLNLLGKMPTKQVLDVSYLLEGGRRRKKPIEKC
ncbi:unnamed protein product [Phaedon cochleariae]|uniref:Histone-lysine N-methyltransferase ash1 n=1 Tax=Phaedon cochleariae TaxID=80249 RepID=A0A9P0DQA0_PHACE|nr:unnamed protein product [Phaedon cochleariae]